MELWRAVCRETVMTALEELAQEYERLINDPEFLAEFNGLLATYAGRPSLLYFAKKLTQELGGAKIYLKREDLNHTGSHKINNVLGGFDGQALGQKACHCRNGRGPARRGDSHSRGAAEA